MKANQEGVPARNQEPRHNEGVDAAPTGREPEATGHVEQWMQRVSSPKPKAAAAPEENKKVDSKDDGKTGVQTASKTKAKRTKPSKTKSQSNALAKVKAKEIQEPRILWSKEHEWKTNPALALQIEELTKVYNEYIPLEKQVDQLRWRTSIVVARMRQLFPNKTPNGVKGWTHFCDEVLKRDECTVAQDLAAFDYLHQNNIDIESLINENKYLPPVAKVARLRSVNDDAKRKLLHKLLFAGKFEGKYNEFEQQVLATKTSRKKSDNQYRLGDVGHGGSKHISSAIREYWESGTFSYMVQESGSKIPESPAGVLEELKAALEAIGMKGGGKYRVGFALWLDSKNQQSN